MIWATDNYFDSDLVNAITTSSENSTYPVTNSYRFQRRGKVFRFNGNVTVTSSNNQIYFNDGSNQTATLTSGDYIMSTTFLVEIKAALEAASVDTFTVTYTNSKITIASSGGTFQLLLTSANFTAEDILGFDNSADLTGALTYTSDNVVIHSQEWIEIDFGVPINPEAFILIGKRNETIKISPSANIKLQGNTTSNWGSPEYDQALTWGENVIYISNSDGLHTQPLRFWRFYIEDSKNAFGYIELSNIFLGNGFVPARGCPQFGLKNNLTDQSVTVYSDSGISLSDVRPQTQQIDFEFKFMTIVDNEELQFIFDVYGTARPFFIILDENEVFSTNSGDWVKYVKFVREPSISIDSPANFSSSISIREEL